MSISRTQPMRQAEIDILDFCDNVGDALTDVSEILSGFTTENTISDAIDDASDAILDIIGSGFDENDTVADAINGEYTARVAADSAIEATIGEGFTSDNTVANAIDEITAKCSGTILSTAGENTKTFSFYGRGEGAFIAIKRGTTACIALFSYWDAGAVVIGDDTNVTFAKTGNSNEFTVTVTTGTGGKGYVTSANVKEVTL